MQSQTTAPAPSDAARPRHGVKVWKSGREMPDAQRHSLPRPLRLPLTQISYTRANRQGAPLATGSRPRQLTWHV